MAGQQKLENSLQDRIDDYLSNFKSSTAPSDDAASVEEASLDDYLMERAAQELREARARLEQISQELEGG